MVQEPGGPGEKFSKAIGLKRSHHSEPHSVPQFSPFHVEILHEVEIEFPSGIALPRHPDPRIAPSAVQCLSLGILASFLLHPMQGVSYSIQSTGPCPGCAVRYAVESTWVLRKAAVSDHVRIAHAHWHFNLLQLNAASKIPWVVFFLHCS